VASSIPAVPGAKVIKALEGVGLPKGTLRAILASIGMTPDEFRTLL
jgi:hypothetical protein